MRNYILIIILFALITGCSAQRGNVWLPEKYVESVVNKEVNAFEYLVPVESIVNPFDSCYLLTYKGELNPVQLKEVFINGQKKYELFNLYYLINLKYNSRERASSYSEAKVYFSRVGNKVLMEIIWKEKKEEVYFINEFDGYIFSDIKESKSYLKRMKD